MGFHEFMARRREAGAERRVERLHKRLMNEHHQTLERKRAIADLEAIGTEDAIYALLGRFTYHTQGSIVDEDEKTMVFDVLRRKGADAIPALEEFIRREKAIYWPLRTLSELAGETRAVDVLLEALDSIEDRWEQSMERMNNLVSCLRDYQDPRVLERLLGLAADDFEEIRFLAVDGLSTFDNDPRAVDAIVERLLDPGETVRVRTFITDLLLDRRWNVKRFKKALTEQLPEGFFIDDTGVISRR
jgi:HEAT repeat protein